MKRSKNFLILVVALSLVAVALTVAHRATRQSHGIKGDFVRCCPAYPSDTSS